MIVKSAGFFSWVYCLVYLFLIIIPIDAVFAYPYENPIFGYTHLLPSPYTLPAGKFALGTTSGIGVTDFLEVDTNVVSDIYGIYNARARFSMLDYSSVSAGLYMGYEYFNLNSISSSNPSTAVNAWMPGGVVGVEVVSNVAVFLGGNLFYSNVNVSGSGIATSGYLQGAQIESDASWAYNPHKHKLGNVLSGGLTYNTTFGFYGFGVSHHWRGLQLGIHYYPNATYYRILPIVSGGMVVDF